MPVVIIATAEVGAGSIEAIVRLSAFAGVLVAMAVWELAAPRRALRTRKRPRWFSNPVAGGSQQLTLYSSSLSLLWLRPR